MQGKAQSFSILNGKKAITYIQRISLKILMEVISMLLILIWPHFMTQLIIM